MLKNLNNILNIAMAEAIVDTYDQKCEDIETKKLNILMIQLRIAVDKSISLYKKVDPKYYDKIDKKINFMRQISCLGQMNSIIIYIDFIIIILDDMLRKTKLNKYFAIKNIIEILLFLRTEFSLSLDEFECSEQAVICQKQWNWIKL